jgi:outer membrane biosynthesis protein TonB
MLAHANEVATHKPMGLLSHIEPRFPAELRGNMSGDGQVVAALTIGVEGQVLDCVALEATRIEFAEAVVNAVIQWRFTPAAVNPILRREVVQFDFKRNGVVTTLQHAEAAQQAFISTVQAQLRTVPLVQLDDEPKRIATVMPKLSKERLAALTGPLMVNFVIDRDGIVRVPVVTTNDAAVAKTVLEAVTQWRYSPPLQQGVPVLVEMTRSLVVP